MIDWKSFGLRYGEKLNKAFEDLTYHLFCYEFNDSKYIFRFHNQKSIETNPITNGDECIGFQTKTYPSISNNVSKFTDTIKNAKETYPQLTKLIFYVYADIGANYNNENNKPDYMLDIEQYGEEYNIKVEWRVKSELENMLLKPKNILIQYRFFSNDYDEIHTIDTFLSKNQNRYRPNLNNPYLKIEKIHKEILEKIKNNDILSIYGNPGIGKTRLAIEIGKYLKNEKNYNVIIIDYPNQNLLYKLKNIIQIDEPYLFIFDNFTNNFDDLYHIIDELHSYCQDKDTKFLFTLKNQYIHDLNRILSDFKYIDQYELHPIADGEMWNIINNISIENNQQLTSFAIERIVQISKGNVSISRMLLDSIEENDLQFVDNYYYIYEKYFQRSKLNELYINNKILGIMSFFDEVNLSNNQLLDEINQIFNCDLRIESETINMLIDNEILDLNNSTLILSDSILSTYLFYSVFIKQEELNLKDLIVNYITYSSRKINDKIYDVINVFGVESFNNIKVSQLDPSKNDLAGNNLVLFYIIFYIYYLNEIIEFIDNWIDKQENEHFEIISFEIPEKHEISTNINEIVLLSRLYYTKFQTLGLQFSMKLIMKKPSLTGDILWAIIENHAYTTSSISNNLNIQNKFMDYVESEIFTADERIVLDKIFLFILYENRFLSWKHMTQTFLNSIIPQPVELTLNPTETIEQFRLRLLKYLLKLCETYPNEIEKILKQYTKSIYENNPILENEEEIIYKIFKKMNFDKYSPNKICYEYIVKMEKASINLNFNFDEFLNKKLLEKISLVSNSLDRYDDKFYEKPEKIQDYLLGNEYDYKELLNLIKEIENNENNVRTYCDAIFTALIEIEFETFIKAFNYYIKNKLNILKSYSFLKSVFECLTGLQCYNLIKDDDYPDKINMIYFYYEFLPEKLINRTITKNLIKFVKKDSRYANIVNFKTYCKFNDQYLKIKDELNAKDCSNILQFLTEIMINNFNKTQVIFYPNFCKDNLKYFKDNIDLIENLYLKLISIKNYDSNFDELETLCKSDEDFLIKYFKYRFIHNNEFYKDSSKIEFIWEKYTYRYNESLVKLIIENYNSDHCCLSLLFSNNNPQEIHFINKFIEKHYENKEYMRSIFEIIKINFNSTYIDFLKKLLDLNDDFDLFELIMAPYIEVKLYNKKGYYNEQIEFYEEIQQMLANLQNPLKFINHIQLVGDIIQKNKEKLSNL